MTGSWTQSFFYAPTMKSWGGRGILVKYSQNDRQLDFISFLWSDGGIICVLQTHFILKKIIPSKTTLSIIIKCGGILLFQFIVFSSVIKLWCSGYNDLLNSGRSWVHALQALVRSNQRLYNGQLLLLCLAYSMKEQEQTSWLRIRLMC